MAHPLIYNVEVGDTVLSNPSLANFKVQTFTGISMIEALDLVLVRTGSMYSSQLTEDYKAVREEMKQQMFLVTGTNLATWNSLSANEKAIVSKHFLVDKTKRTETYTETQQEGLAVLFHLSSITAREVRSAKAMAKIYNKLDVSDQQVIVDDVELDNLFAKYKFYGREGTVEGDLEGLFDFIESRTGTKYDANGATKGIKGRTLVGMTSTEVDALTNDVMNIMKLGQ